jgi:thiamine-triphosphatase
MVLLEIEQKFTLLPSLVQAFHLNKGVPQFTSIKSLGTVSFNDAYFEDKDSQIFSRNGIWIRKRDGIWEAKRRPTANKDGNLSDKKGILQNTQKLQSGDSERASYNRTAFEEIRDHQRIQSLVNDYIPNSGDATQNFGLDAFCQFRTNRKTYLVDNKFSVMLDETSFGHSSGEVEVEVDIDLTEGKGKDAAIEKAHEDIGNFLDKYSWFFRAGGAEKPKGKLTAYFEAFPPAWEK